MTILTVDEALRMVAAGAIPEDSTMELLNGVVVRKVRGTGAHGPYMHSPAHIAAIERLTDLVFRIESINRFAQVQLPVICSRIDMPESATYRTKVTVTRDDTLTLNGGSDGSIEVRATELLP
jgi:hypothetical protein